MVVSKHTKVSECKFKCNDAFNSVILIFIIKKIRNKELISLYANRPVVEGTGACCHTG